MKKKKLTFQTLLVIILLLSNNGCTREVIKYRPCPTLVTYEVNTTTHEPLKIDYVIIEDTK